MIYVFDVVMKTHSPTAPTLVTQRIEIEHEPGSRLSAEALVVAKLFADNFEPVKITPVV